MKITRDKYATENLVSAHKQDAQRSTMSDKSCIMKAKELNLSETRNFSRRYHTITFRYIIACL